MRMRIRPASLSKGLTIFSATGIILLTALSAVSACGKKKSSVSSGPTGQLALNFATANSNTDGTSSSFNFADTEFAPTAAQPSSIASGAPDSFEVNLLSMDLRGKADNGNETNVNIFKSDSGKPIKITGSEIDLSQLFTTYECYKKDGSPLTLAAGETCKCGVGPDDKLIAPQSDGSCKQTNAQGALVEITEPAGILDISALKYTELRVTFAPKAKIKGCVSATFKNDPGNVANGSVGLQTYCTQTEKASTNESITPVHADFKNVTAQETELFLNKSWESRASNMQLSFPIKDGLTITAGQKSNLTMVIDVNRMLRFYNMGRTDSGPNPGFPTTRAYFFTTVFEDSLFVFAGKAGSIRGYSWQTDTCTGSFSNAYNCASPSSVDGWMTLILDSSGTPFVASAMPNDDNNLTTLKGGNRKAQIGIDSSMISKNTDGTYNVAVSLNGEVDPTIYKFDLSGALNSSFETDYRGTKNGSEDTFGRIKLTRGL